ncbi:hypothetical protein Ancab_035850 [Ancistrocladus abbreviatus]
MFEEAPSSIDIVWLSEFEDNEARPHHTNQSNSPCSKGVSINSFGIEWERCLAMGEAQQEAEQSRAHEKETDTAVDRFTGLKNNSKEFISAGLLDISQCASEGGSSLNKIVADSEELMHVAHACNKGGSKANGKSTFGLEAGGLTQNPRVVKGESNSEAHYSFSANTQGFISGDVELELFSEPRNTLHIRRGEDEEAREMSSKSKIKKKKNLSMFYDESLLESKGGQVIGAKAK